MEEDEEEREEEEDEQDEQDEEEEDHSKQRDTSERFCPDCPEHLPTRLVEGRQRCPGCRTKLRARANLRGALERDRRLWGR